MEACHCDVSWEWRLAVWNDEVPSGAVRNTRGQNYRDRLLGGRGVCVCAHAQEDRGGGLEHAHWKS